MITIFSPTETSFISDGLGVIDKIVMDCIVKHEINAAYFLELTAVVDDEKLFELIDYDNIIKANGQIFRIIDIDKDTDFIYAKALHIFYDLQNNFLEDVAPTNKNCGDALNWILQRTVYPNPFVGSSDIANLRTARYVRYSPTDAIMGRIDNSFLNVWGGEILRNNYSIEILSRLGRDTEVEISYGKNITGIEETIIKSNVVTKIMPQGFDGLLLPEKYVDSPYILSYPMPIIRKIEFRDVKVNDDPDLGPVVTEAQAYDMLRDLAAKKFSVDKIDLPLVNYKVNFVDLSQTEEYKEYQVLESLSLGDSATVKHERLGITVTARVISTVWDVMGERYRAIELGNFSQNLQSYIKDVNEETKESIFIDSVQSASELIRNGLGGYTKKTREEFLIMDTTDENTAQELWRWNRNGLGWSGTGYNGTYGIALTKDGKINASMIKTGKLLAEYIEAVSLSAISSNIGLLTAGIIRSSDGNIELNLNDKIWKFLGNTVKMTTEGLNVGVDSSSVNTDLAYNGISIKDGDDLIAVFGESGAVIPKADIGDITNAYIFKKVTGRTVTVGAGKEFSTLDEAFDTLFAGPIKYLEGTMTFDLYGSLSGNASLTGVVGGIIRITTENMTSFSGSMTFTDCSSYIMVIGNQYSVKLIRGTIYAYRCPNVYARGFNISGTNGIVSRDGSNIFVFECDIKATNACLDAAMGGEITALLLKGNGTYGSYAATGGKIYLRGTAPKGSVMNNRDNSSGYDGFVYPYGTVTYTDSAFSPPAITYQTMKQVFNASEILTLVHNTSTKNTYFGASAAQNRWSTSNQMNDGVIRFGRNVSDFFTGGTDIVVKIRIRRKNSSHGTSGNIAPFAYMVNGTPWSSSFSAVPRGGWTNWVTIPKEYFSSSGAEFKLYNGVTGVSGYAIFDACEIEVTATKQI